MRGDCLSRVPNERPKLLLNPLPLTARNFASSREPDAPLSSTHPVTAWSQTKTTETL